MNLVIDKGNTCAKVAIFAEGKMIYLRKISSLSCEEIESFFFNFEIKRTIFSTVSEVNSSVLSWLENQNKLLFLSYQTPLPIKVAYRTPKTLGVDRLAAVMGAHILRPNDNFLVIDCGTCITFDLFVDGVYLGGNILPGMEMRFEALHHQTSKLPRIKPQKSNLLFGNDTQTAIRAGVQNGIVYEINGFIADVKRKYGNLTFFLTGGDAPFFEKQLKKYTFAVENLTLIGLNGILEYNA